MSGRWYLLGLTLILAGIGLVYGIERMGRWMIFVGIMVLVVSALWAFTVADRRLQVDKAGHAKYYDDGRRRVR